MSRNSKYHFSREVYVAGQGWKRAIILDHPAIEAALDIMLQELPPEDAAYRKERFFKRMHADEEESLLRNSQ